VWFALFHGCGRCGRVFPFFLLFLLEIFQEFFRSKIRTSANFLGEVFRTEIELKIRNEIERKMQDIQPNVEKEKWLSVWGKKDIFLFQHSVGYLATFFQFHF
jgi:hypothetical protein